MLLGIAVALFSGLAIALQSLFNADLQKSIGLAGLVFWVHLSGLLVCIPLLMVFEPNFFQNLLNLREKGVPLYILTGGVMGVIIIPGIAFAITRTNPAIALALSVVAQLAMSLVIQQFGWFGVPQSNISLTKVLAVLLIAGGVALFFHEQ
jgi:bacterial/archaeal transporter family-2 protein